MWDSEQLVKSLVRKKRLARKIVLEQNRGLKQSPGRNESQERATFSKRFATNQTLRELRDH